MPCPNYGIGGFGCGGCPKFTKSTSIALSGSTLTITIPNVKITNKCGLCIALAQCIPDTVTQDTTVVIAVNGTTFQLINTCGNNVYGDQLRSRRVLHVTFATDTKIAMVSNSRLCKTEHSFPVIPVPAPATANTQASVTSDVYSYTDKEV